MAPRHVTLASPSSSRAALAAVALAIAFGFAAGPTRAATAATRPTGAAAAPATAPALKDQATLDREFSAMMSNVRLTGSYTAGDVEGVRNNDGYTILKAERAEGDVWAITAVMTYKGVGVPVELRLPVLWAGDTPVLTLTDHKIPGMGSFTVRLLFYRGEYAGTWSSARHGGLMWGKIEKIEAPKPADPPIQPAK